MYLTDDGRVVTSPSDLTTAAACEFAFLRGLDARLGRIEAPAQEDDPMLRRAAALGDVHEAKILERYREQYAVVVEIERPDVRDTAALEDATARTRQAFEDGADLVFQAAFFDGELLGFADFIVRRPDGSYEVQDSKLARSAKVTALLQLAAYAEQLELIGVPVAPRVTLLLGNGRSSEHALVDIAPVYRERRAHLRRIIAERLADDAPVAWGDERYGACGRCATCELEVEATRDLLLVGGLRATTRTKLRAAGITTIDELAASKGGVEGVAASTLTSLRAQATLQLRARDGARPPFELVDLEAVAALPAPDPGDIFFDFEGDPLYSEPGDEDETRWGLDYLFGLVEADGTFRAFWAHDLAEEGVALRDFLDYLAERRSRFPGMHVYHYASYERTHLLSLAARHGIGEDEVDDLLREQVLVDLYPVVRGAVRVGSRSYSLKKIEPLYLDAARTVEVTTAGDSVEEYARYRSLREAGAESEAAELLDQIADYNEADCASTLALRDWLLARAAEHGVRPGGARPGDTVADHGTPGAGATALGEAPAFVETPVALQLRELAGPPSDPHRTADQRALGLASAAVDYHRRERKSFWWGHFDRLVQPIEDWAETRDVLVVREAVVVEDWHRETPRQSLRRVLRIRGDLGPGSTLSAGSKAFAVYPPDGPQFAPPTGHGARMAHGSAEILEVAPDGAFLVRELLRRTVDEYDDLPVALTPGRPPAAAALESAIAEWGAALLAGQPGLPRDAAADILRRTPPRTRGRGGLVRADDVAGPGGGAPTTVDALVASLLDLDSSYIAVQGPPGTGKTYTGAHVINALARAGWKIGVVAQSHATVENLLAAVLDAGLDPVAVGKKPRDDDDRDQPWRALTPSNQSDFLAEPGGRVLGGTAWVFSNTKHVGRGELDLLVIDEAGQFSLAATVAVGVATKNLLLLGDPQQLPQVSQGQHPEPVDGSALGWISDGHDVLPPELGYFLAASRRMAGPLTKAVSELSYDGELAAHPVADERRLEGVAAGVHAVPVTHAGNATESPEEAAEVVRLVQRLLGTAWTDPSAGRDGAPLLESDIIVVAPYNAQVTRVREALERAGLRGVRVGTVDKFQGQEAVVAIVTLAASSPADVPRGMGFLIMRNRINVAISRAQWAAYVLHSPTLVDYLPSTPAALAELSALLRTLHPTTRPPTEHAAPPAR